MALTVSAVPIPNMDPRLRTPELVPRERNWRADSLPPERQVVEELACRFAWYGDRKAVRAYLYASIGDLEAVRLFCARNPKTGWENLKSRRRYRHMLWKGHTLLEAAKKEHPEIFREFAERLEEAIRGR